MNTTEQSVERLKEEVGNLVGPFLDKYNSLDGEIKKREKRIEELKKEISELRGARSYLRTIVRNINPDLIPSIHKNGRGPGRPKKTSSKVAFGAETREVTTIWLQTRKEDLNAMNKGQGFRPSDLYGREGFPLRSTSGTNKLLIALHEGGVLHLSKWVKGKPYGEVLTGKFYKVV